MRFDDLFGQHEAAWQFCVAPSGDVGLSLRSDPKATRTPASVWKAGRSVSDAGMFGGDDLVRVVSVGELNCVIDVAQSPDAGPWTARAWHVRTEEAPHESRTRTPIHLPMLLWSFVREDQKPCRIWASAAFTAVVRRSRWQPDVALGEVP